MYSEYKLVQQCLVQIEESLDWGPSRNWHNEVFSELSERIQQDTHVLLSPTTLKRVWGKVNYKSAPSITTLNTLAQFAGFTNWRDFKNQSKVKKKSPFLEKFNANIGVIMLAASVMTIVFISFYSLKEPKPAITIDVDAIHFQSRPISNSLPNSVVFDFDLANVTSDSIHIQQYWDPTKTIELEKDQKQATGQYYYPGYFRAKLLVDGEAIKQHDLFIKSDGWLGTLDYSPVPKYVNQDLILNKKLAFSSAILEEIKTSERPFNTTFHLVEAFKPVSGDNFSLQTKLRVCYNEKWAVCQRAQILVLGTKSALVLGTAIPGCVSEIGVMMSDVYLDGKKHDLSNLGIDLSDFKNLTLKVVDKKMEVLLEGQSIFKGSYNESIGNIVGLRYRFLGAGELAGVSLKNIMTDEIIINEDFK